MKFNVVVGNPPYQKSGVTLGQGQIYPKFIKQSMNILTENGSLVFITPPTFLKDKIKCINGAQIKWIMTDVSHHFSVGSTIIAYELIKTHTPIITQLITVKSSDYIQINYDSLIPVGHMNKISFSVIDKLYSASGDYFDFIRDEKPFPLNAVFIRRQNRNKYFNAVLSNDITNPNQDYTSAKNPENKKALLNSKLFSFIYMCYSTSPFITLGFINKIPVPNEQFKKMSDKEIYEYYGLTEEEINYIEESVK